MKPGDSVWPGYCQGSGSTGSSMVTGVSQAATSAAQPSQGQGNVASSTGGITYATGQDQ